MKLAILFNGYDNITYWVLPSLYLENTREQYKSCAGIITSTGAKIRAATDISDIFSGYYIIENQRFAISSSSYGRWTGLAFG